MPLGAMIASASVDTLDVANDLIKGELGIMGRVGHAAAGAGTAGVSFAVDVFFGRFGPS